MEYQEFLNQKHKAFQSVGFDPVDPFHDSLFPFQRDLVTWALRKGRAAIWAGTGLGKTRMQLEWARAVKNYTGKPVIIFAPLAVSKQTQLEGKKIGIDITIMGDGDIRITNYEKLSHINPADFSGIVLDESSILKNFAGQFRNQIIDAFRNTPYKLCCSATPSPNDYTEIGNHAEFLNVCPMNEMIATYFIHDSGETQKKRLMGHAEKPFFEWLASWAVMLSKPSDLGYSDEGYNLPPMTIVEHVVGSEAQDGKLFVEHARGLMERRQARRESIRGRCNLAASLSAGSKDHWIYWCDLNDESSMLTDWVENSVEVRGSGMSNEIKEERLIGFANGEYQKLVTKPKIAQFGLNLQICNNVVFVGLSDSFEAYYQAVRRCWRFGQKKPVNVHVVISEKEGSVVENIKEKERKMAHMTNSMVECMRAETLKNIKAVEVKRAGKYNPKIKMQIPEFARRKAA